MSVVNETLLLELCVRFLQIYPSHPAQLSADTEQLTLAREIATAFEQTARILVPNEHWKGDASCGAGNWSKTPWAAVYDTRETSKASEGVYPVIHFVFDQSDGSPTGQPGIRLGLGVSVREFGGREMQAQVRTVAGGLRKSVTETEDFQPFWFAGSDQTRPTPAPDGGLGRKYYDGMVLEHFVPTEQLTTSPGLLNDELKKLLGWYKHWIDSKQGRSAEPDTSSFLEVMRRYKQEGTVFLSPKQQRRYCIVDVDDNGCEVRRLSGGDNQRCTVSLFESGLQRLSEAGGQMALQQFVEADRVVKATFAQAPHLAISADRNDVVDVSHANDAVTLLCKYVDLLRVDTSSGTPRLYKPGMLAAVVEAVRDGKLVENRIEFSWIAREFIAKMASVGQAVGDTQAAEAFFHLSSEPFWLLCYAEPERFLTSDDVSISKIKDRVKYATLRDPFWNALQEPNACSRVLDQLQKTWWPDVIDDIQIDEALLANAVDQTIRPLLIDQRQLDENGDEGYQHHKVIPTAQPRLQRQALEEDAVENVSAALKANVNLLSQFELMWATTLLDHANPDEVREQTKDLLFGGDELGERVRRFLSWGEVHTPEDGPKRGFNATCVSYLLGVSQPEKYAFCKPTVYTAAAKALLGAERVKSDKAERVAHAAQFYAAALRLFRDKHGLPFSDLMHCHIAFYVMQQENDFPTWKDLVEPDGSNDGERRMIDDLNVVLYGPPGTGKTYQTISRAVEICDGTVPVDRRDLVDRFNDLRSEDRIEFVTFHQSYGYEDFVEGIRPVLRNEEEADLDNEADKNSEELKYECVDGVLKRICSYAAAKTSKRGSGFQFDPSVTPVWKMSLGSTVDPDQAIIYDECIENGYILLGYGGVADFTGCNTRLDVEQKLKSHYPQIKDTDYDIRAVDTFKNKLNVGDLVVVSDGNRRFRAIGKITGPYSYLERDSFRQKRPVEWLVVFEESLPHEKISNKAFSQKAIYRIRPSFLKVEGLKELLASDEPAEPRNHVLIIDEINRGNIAKILGELITLLEPDKRLGAANAIMATLPYSRQPLGVPQNLYIVGTMNTADRSIALLDAALRRRFKFVEMMPDYEVVRREVGDDGVINGVDVAGLLETMNDRVELLYDRDHQIGHSYILDVESLGDLRRSFEEKMIPLLQEYFYGDWGKVCVILGCPYNPETGEHASENEKPIIKATMLKAQELPGGAGEEFEDKVRCFVNPEFQNASEGDLVDFFNAVVNPGSVSR